MYDVSDRYPTHATSLRAQDTGSPGTSAPGVPGVLAAMVAIDRTWLWAACRRPELPVSYAPSALYMALRQRSQPLPVLVRVGVAAQVREVPDGVTDVRHSYGDGHSIPTAAQIHGAVAAMRPCQLRSDVIGFAQVGPPEDPAEVELRALTARLSIAMTGGEDLELTYCSHASGAGGPNHTYARRFAGDEAANPWRRYLVELDYQQLKARR